MSDVDNRSRLKKRLAARKSGIWFKLVEGENTFRILPTPASKTTDADWWEYRQHRDVGPKKQRVRCGKDIDGKGRCWLCDVKIPELQEKGREGAAGALRAQDVANCQVASVDPDDGTMRGPLLFQPSKKVGDQLLSSIFLAKKKNHMDVKKGRNITIDRTGTGMMDTRYGMISLDDDPSAVPEEIVSVIKPFSQLKEIPLYSEAAQKAAYLGKDVVPSEKTKSTRDEDDDVDEDEDDDLEETDEEEEDLPTPRALKGKATKKKVVEEDEDEDTDDEEDDEEPVAPPKKGKAPPAKATKKVVEEEDEEDDLDDEDEDEAPPPPKKGATKKAPVEAEDDNDEPDDLDFDDDDEEEEAPKKKSAPIKKDSKLVPVDEDEDDVDEDDEDEDLPPPPKKKGPVKKK